MWLFWLMSIKIAWLNIDIELIIDIIAILIIVIFAIYTVFKSKKNDKWNLDKYDNEAWIDDKKWLVIERVKEGRTKYKDTKWTIKALLSLLWIHILIIATIFCLVGIGYSLYEIFTDQTDSETILSLIILSIILWFSILGFVIIKKLSDKIQKNLLYKIIRLFCVMFVALIIILLWISIGNMLCEFLNLNNWLLLILQLMTIFLWMLWWFIFLVAFNWFSQPSKKDLQGILKFFGSLVISIIIGILWRFLGIFICSFLKLDGERTFFIPLIFWFLSMMWRWWWLLYIRHYNEKVSSNEYLNQFHDSINEEKSEDNSPKEITYEDLINNNKKLEEKTWFHQWPLLD